MNDAPVPVGDPAPLSQLEVASGMVLGQEPGVRLPPDQVVGKRPRDVFEDVLLAALRRPPCVVSFSGGRDSSAVLALAVALARREGLPEPIPLTLRFPQVPSTEEAEWQERVVGHLGVRDWECVELDDVDLLGDVALGELARHGVMYPPNAFVHGPLAERAAGGTLVTGIGGDEAMTAARRWNRLSRVLAGQRRPRPADFRDALLAVAPREIRRWDVRRRTSFDPAVPWLRPGSAGLIRRRWLDDVVAGPVRYDRMLARFTSSRARLLGLATLDRVTRARGVVAAHPFAAPAFLGALAAGYGLAGPRNRTQAMTDLFSDVLPEEVLRRSTKATFNQAFWGPATRRFVEGWDGEGVDSSTVDVARLRAAWSEDNPDYRGFLLLQSAWMATQASRSANS